MTRTILSRALLKASSSVRSPLPWTDRLVRTPRRWGLRSARVKADRPAEVPGARSAKLARVEAALFAAGDPLSTRRIAEVANLADGTEARLLLQELNALYDADGAAFTLENVAGGWQIRTRPQFAPWLAKLHAARQESRLSQPALETLAVVAYRQPILRADIEAVRGVACGEMLRHLIDRGLVRIVGHHDSLGRPLLYGTTRRFLEHFGLADLSELPLAEQLRAPASAPAKPPTPVAETLAAPETV
jgi:segregation and condensation protein B